MTIEGKIQEKINIEQWQTLDIWPQNQLLRSGGEDGTMKIKLEVTQGQAYQHSDGDRLQQMCAYTPSNLIVL